MISTLFVIGALLLLSAAHTGSAIQCFQCVEQKGGDGICRDDSGTKHASVSCAHSCITHTMAPFSIGGVETGEMIARLCTDPSYCQIGTSFMEQKVGLKTISCTSCQSSYCNSASTAIPSFILVAILALKYYFF